MMVIRLPFPAACKKCGSIEKTSRGDECKTCANVRSAIWRSKNKDKAKRAVSDWVKKNPEKKKQSDAIWASQNKDKRRASYEKWMKLHPNAQSKNNAEWYLNNKDRRKQTNLNWCLKNPGAQRRNAQTRRARKAKSNGVLSKQLSEKLFKLQNGKCPCCGKSLGSDFHMDHVIPLVLGGLNTDSNIQLLTSTCNLQKNAKHPVDFMQQRGFLL